MVAPAVEFDSVTGEPFLRLQKHANLILTPIRDADVAESVVILNDERVASWLEGPPYPYKQEDAEWWINFRKGKIAESKIYETIHDPNPPLVEDYLLDSIREVQEDGSQKLIGSLGFTRCGWMEVAYGPGANWEAKDTLLKENNERKLGDPDILWTIGYLLSPTHFGQGIMPDAVQTVLHGWGIPRMGIRKMVGLTYDGNVASSKVLEKVGFVQRETVPNWKEVKGIMRAANVFEWKLVE